MQYSSPLENCSVLSLWEWTQGILEVCLLLLIVVGNSLVIMSIVVVKVLRQPKNYLILNLAVADLLVGILIMPFKILLTVNCDFWKIGNFLCYVWISTDVMCCTTSIFSLCVISLDRYIAISRPLSYRVNSTATKVYCAIAITWIFSFLTTIPHWSMAELYLEKAFGAACMYYQTPWFQLYAVSTFFVPLFVKYYIYWSIVRVMKTQKMKFPVLKMARPLQEKKGCIMVGIVMGVFTACWLPFFTLMLVDCVYGFLGKDLYVPFWITDAFITFGHLNSCVNPFIYTMFNKDFRLSFKELICLRGSSLNSKIRTEVYSKQVGIRQNSAISSCQTSEKRQQSTKSSNF